jgi:hypothetical protein
VAGPSITVRVLGDLGGLGKAFDSAAAKGATAASGLHKAFSGTLDALNKTGVLGPFGDALSGIDEAIGSIGKHAKDIGPSMLGIGGAMAGIGAGLSAVGSKDQAAHQQLQASVEATGASYDDYAKRIEGAIKHQEKFGDTAGQTQDALRVLTQATGSPTKALGLLSEATDLAAAKHEDLNTAATQLGKVYNGNGKLLKEFGIQTTKAGSATKGLETATKQANAADKALASAKQHLADIEALDAGKKKLTTSEAIRLRDAQNKVRDATVTARTAHQKLAAAQDAAKNSAKNQGGAMVELAAKLHGQASAAADTFGGKMSALKAHIEDAAASFGQKYGPAITAIGSGVAVIGGAVTATTGIFEAMGGAAKATEAASGAATAAETVTEAAGAPLLLTLGLIALAVAALVVVGYELYKHWSTIWAFIKRIVKDVWDWIKVNWPLLLGILLGPIALAVAVIYRYHTQILAAFQAILGWIAREWGKLLGWIIAPFAAAWQYIARIWSDVTAAASGVLGWFAHTWQAISGTISGAVHNGIEAIKSGFENLVGYFTQLPARLATLFTHMWDGIWFAFKSTINLLIDGWNSLHFKTPSFKLPFPPHTSFPSVSIGVPNIPRLAQGGLITSTGLILAHAGEAIVPAPKGVARGGPAVVINNAHFSTELDVEAFMRRAAWVAKTQAV